jgi:hypothetical protein
MHELAPTARMGGDGSVSVLDAVFCVYLLSVLECFEKGSKWFLGWCNCAYPGHRFHSRDAPQSERMAPFHLIGGQRRIFMKCSKNELAPTTPKLTNLTAVLASRQMHNLTSTFPTKRINRCRTKWPISRSILHVSRAARNGSLVCT